jgi:hypothetical protein
MTPEQTQRLEEFAAKLSEYQEAAIGVGIYAGRGELELLRREITRPSTIQGELLEACERDRIIIQTPTPPAASDALDELRARVSELEGALHGLVRCHTTAIPLDDECEWVKAARAALHKGEDKP